MGVRSSRISRPGARHWGAGRCHFNLNSIRSRPDAGTGRSWRRPTRPVLLILAFDLSRNVGVGLPAVTTAQSESLQAHEIFKLSGYELRSSEYAQSVEVK
jgi:hypothetical protein